MGRTLIMMDTLLLTLTCIISDFILPCLTWCKDGDSSGVDPLWIVTGAVGSIFGFLQWSLSRNVNTLDADIKELKEELKEARAENRDLRDRIIAIATSYDKCDTCNRRKGDLK
jgi:hypothetical protein